jgi:UDPglucose--hexose-1-phosphate uridylyltransferase
MDLSNHPHKRHNVLTGEWVLVSPHRTKRPWQGKIEKATGEHRPSFDPGCYLCPGNERAGGQKNPEYDATFVFDNDFAALLPDVPNVAMDERGLLVARSERGLCRVVCFSPRHDRTLALMAAAEIRRVVDVWCDEYAALGAREDIGYVQIFENRGDIMGCSNPHPHGQIWATETVPQVPSLEEKRQAEHRRMHGRCLLCDYVALELEKKERVVVHNERFVALVPFWAVWPFEVMVLPRAHVKDVAALDGPSRQDLADIMRRVGIRFDNLFSTSFPYSMGIHQRPTDGDAHDEWHMHLHYLPPLLRSATVRKFMVGFELLATPQRDITPESAAERLRDCSETHFEVG